MIAPAIRQNPPNGKDVREALLGSMRDAVREVFTDALSVAAIRWTGTIRVSSQARAFQVQVEQGHRTGIFGKVTTPVEQQIVIAVDRAGQAVLDRRDAAVRVAGRHGGEHRLEGVTRHRRDFAAEKPPRRHFAERAALALIRHSDLLAHRFLRKSKTPAPIARERASLLCVLNFSRRWADPLRCRW